jgi:hypothetical protein
MRKPDSSTWRAVRTGRGCGDGRRGTGAARPPEVTFAESSLRHGARSTFYCPAGESRRPTMRSRPVGLAAELISSPAEPLELLTSTSRLGLLSSPDRRRHAGAPAPTTEPRLPVAGVRQATSTGGAHVPVQGSHRRRLHTTGRVATRRRGHPRSRRLDGQRRDARPQLGRRQVVDVAPHRGQGGVAEEAWTRRPRSRLEQGPDGERVAKHVGAHPLGRDAGAPEDGCSSATAEGPCPTPNAAGLSGPMHHECAPTGP